MEKTFSFGKHAIVSKRNINAVDVIVGLKQDKEGRDVFTASARVWNGRHTDIAMGGQCLDTIAEKCKALSHDALYSTILGLWKRNHLNDMHAGTEKQERAIEEWHKQSGKVDGYFTYEETCDYLKSVGLYEDDGYVYGTSWLYKAISDADKQAMMELFK